MTDTATPKESVEDESPAAGTAGRGLSPQAQLVLAVVLSCALVAAIVIGVLLAVRYDDAAGATVAGGSSRVDASMARELQERADVQAAVETFVVNLNSYSVKDIDGYKQRLRPLLTPGFAKSFDLAVDNIIAQVRATEMTSEGEVLKTAVSTIDADNATALVVADAHVTSALGERQRHFRWQVTLVKTDDTWLVDNFAPVA